MRIPPFPAPRPLAGAAFGLGLLATACTPMMGHDTSMRTSALPVCTVDTPPSQDCRIPNRDVWFRVGRPAPSQSQATSDYLAIEHAMSHEGRGP